jgi:hypothetical protein
MVRGEKSGVSFNAAMDEGEIAAGMMNGLGGIS